MGAKIFTEGGWVQGLYNMQYATYQVLHMKINERYSVLKLLLLPFDLGELPNPSTKFIMPIFRAKSESCRPSSGCHAFNRISSR